MSETTTPTQTVELSAIHARRAEWQLALDEVNKQLTVAAEQITKLQQQALALTGAIQACDALVSAPPTSPVPTE
jgi:uncharacterized coiled-coil protein SlyX